MAVRTSIPSVRDAAGAVAIATAGPVAAANAASRGSTTSSDSSYPPWKRAGGGPTGTVTVIVVCFSVVEAVDFTRAATSVAPFGVPMPLIWSYPVPAEIEDDVDPLVTSLKSAS